MLGEQLARSGIEEQHGGMAADRGGVAGEDEAALHDGQGDAHLAVGAHGALALHRLQGATGVGGADAHTSALWQAVAQDVCGIAHQIVGEDGLAAVGQRGCKRVLQAAAVGVALLHGGRLALGHGSLIGVAEHDGGAVGGHEDGAERGAVGQVGAERLCAVLGRGDGDGAHRGEHLAGGAAVAAGGEQGAGASGAVGQHLGHVDGGTSDALPRLRVDDGEADGGSAERAELQADGGVSTMLAHGVADGVGLFVARGQLVA